MAMMAWGEFVFELNTAPYQELQHAKNFRFEKTERFGTRQAFQFTGIGDDIINLRGVVYGGQVGSYQSLAQIADLAAEGDAQTLIDGVGNVIGDYVLTQFDITASVFFPDGKPKKQEFSLTLERAA